MTLLKGSASTEIDADIDRCWAVVEDIADAPRWQNGLEDVAVVERDDQGRVLIADTINDAKFRKVSCRIRVTYDPPRRLEFSRVQSDDLDEMKGSWELEDLGGGRTRATYQLALDPGKIGFMARPLEKALRPVVVGGRPAELAREVGRRG